MRRRAGPGRGLPFPHLRRTHATSKKTLTSGRQALHLVLDGVYRRSDAGPFFVKVPASTDDELQTVLHAEVFSSFSRSSVLVGDRNDPGMPFDFDEDAVLAGMSGA